MPDYGFLVVARYREGRIVRGTTSDFRPGRAFFHVIPDEGGGPERVMVSELKAVFFVRTLFGDHLHQETKSFRHRQGVGRKVWLRFTDGEEITGWTLAYTPEKGGFFLFPTDANANAEKAFVVNESIAAIRLDEDAERAAHESEERQPKSNVRRLSSDAWNRMLGIERSGRAPADRPRRGEKRDSGIFLGDW